MTVKIDLGPIEALAKAVPETHPWLNSLIITLEGSVVFETHFHKFSLDEPTNVYSITKCWMSCLTGIALEKRLLPPIDTPLADIFENRVPANCDSRKRAITLRHCLALQSGLGYVNSYEFATELGAEADPVAFFFGDRLPVRYPPGTVWNYSGADSQMVAEALRACIDRPLTDVAREWLAAPLGIEQFRWPRHFPTPGAAIWPAEIGASELSLTPRDLVRLGECICQDGRHGGRQVVPADWLELATTPTAGVDLAYLNGFYASLGLPPLRGDAAGYGLHFPLRWLGGHRMVTLAGSGGQYVFVAPELALVVVQTADMTDPSSMGEGIRGGIDIMLDVVLPALSPGGAARPEPA